MSTQKFPKKEHLKSRKYIQMLFRSGEAFSVFPFRMIYQPFPASKGECKVSFSVSSKKFKKAIDRNRIKRQMRESYRLQKKILSPALSEQKMSLHVFFLYTGKKLPEFAFLQKKMKQSLNKLEKKLSKGRHLDEKNK